MIWLCNLNEVFLSVIRYTTVKIDEINFFFKKKKTEKNKTPLNHVHQNQLFFLLIKFRLICEKKKVCLGVDVAETEEIFNIFIFSSTVSRGNENCIKGKEKKNQLSIWRDKQKHCINSEHFTLAKIRQTISKQQTLQLRGSLISGKDECLYFQ